MIWIDSSTFFLESEDSNFECQQSKADAKRAKITAVIKVCLEMTVFKLR